jgi:hypothetical protein
LEQMTYQFCAVTRFRARDRACERSGVAGFELTEQIHR